MCRSTRTASFGRLALRITLVKILASFITEARGQTSANDIWASFCFGVLKSLDDQAVALNYLYRFPSVPM